MNSVAVENLSCAIFNFVVKDLLSAVQSGVDALPYKESVVGRIMGVAGELGEEWRVADGDRVLPQGILGPLEAVEVCAVSAQLQQLREGGRVHNHNSNSNSNITFFLTLKFLQ